MRDGAHAPSPLFVGRRRFLPLVLLICLVGLVSSPAFAVPVTVTPTTVVLAPGQATALVTITNEGDTATRFEAQLHAWSESPDGATVLEPTTDVIAFPQLITLQPKESKKIRIGTEKPPAVSERSYRLILQELPQVDRGSGVVEIQVLSKVSLPIFLTPRGAQPKAVIDTAGVKDGMLTFDVMNAGSMRFVLRQVSVVGRDAAGETFSINNQGWYVLAGGSRTYYVALGAADCRRATEIEITASSDTAAAATRVPIGPASCGDSQESRFLKADPRVQAPS